MELRDKVIDGAGKLFITEGIRRVTMDYIAKKLGVSKRTIYENFNDKTELLKASLIKLLDFHDSQFAELANNSSNVLEILVGAIKFGVSSIKEVSPMFLYDLEVHYPAIWDEYILKRREKSADDFTQLVFRGISEGFFREGLNVKLVSKIFVEQMNAMNRKDVFPPDEYPAVELFETLFVNFIRGISTLNGIQKLEELLYAEK